jgi:hypothetical protein
MTDRSAHAAKILSDGCLLPPRDPRHYVPTITEVTPLAKLLALPADDIFRVELYAVIVQRLEWILLGNPYKAIGWKMVADWKSVARGQFAAFAPAARAGDGFYVGDVAVRGVEAMLTALAASPLPSQVLPRAAAMQAIAAKNPVRSPARRGRQSDIEIELLAADVAMLARRFKVTWSLPSNGDIWRMDAKNISDWTAAHAPFAVFVEMQKLLIPRLEALVKVWNRENRIHKSKAAALLKRVAKLKAINARQLSEKLKAAQVS